MVSQPGARSSPEAAPWISTARHSGHSSSMDRKANQPVPTACRSGSASNACERRLCRSCTAAAAPPCRYKPCSTKSNLTPTQPQKAIATAAQWDQELLLSLPLMPPTPLAASALPAALPAPLKAARPLPWAGLPQQAVVSFDPASRLHDTLHDKPRMSPPPARTTLRGPVAAAEAFRWKPPDGGAPAIPLEATALSLRPAPGQATPATRTP
mmetsp:Transcript_9910/g.28756  ORF Transcript_9910/g.28756 Transcript_9910/m.28756 type:complete len:211 (-) Transcript_9910:474-1106(-)